ncbi:MAG TPA: Spy/CpxP family protein refolding chaperone [Syntrophorhabdaceae bacterium]|nr:Spy/CpxP family protein refolding chaperone [Syntrophorhabdaceae bacterium]
MKKLLVVIAVVVVAIAAIVFSVFAAPADQASPAGMGAWRGGPAGEEGAYHGGPFQHKDMRSRLNLTKDQMDKMRDIRTRYHKETRDMRYELAQKRLEMHKLFTDPKTDDATLLAKQKELSVLRARLSDKMAEMSIEMRRVFTPDQLEKLDSFPLNRHHGWR